MHLKDKYLRAFTVIELLVVLILSSIVSAMMYYAYFTVQSYYLTFSERMNTLSTIHQLNFQLQKDFEQARIVNKGDSLSLLLEFASVDRKTHIAYQFGENIIIRQQQTQTDTFGIPWKNLFFYNDNEPIVNLNQLVDKMAFEAECAGETLTFHYWKVYASEILMQTAVDSLDFN